MDILQPPARFSAFMTVHLPDFLYYFGIDYSIDGPQLEYFVYQKKTKLDISCSLTFSYDNALRQIEVMTFYPGLWLYPGTRYFSAACFFMVIQHVANFYHVESACRIGINTEKNVFDTFYSLLKDFDFHIQYGKDDERVHIESPFLSSKIDTSMFFERALTDIPGFQASP